ncbi:acetyltransferase [Penicillium atrosanguineum]|uniref:Acetyltransferase n=1 Tax=Penicillium atrosanguineum TaxID=1132637 RepID=A0A9W9HIY8_9EURO|nr:MFS-type transporter [Penicillium atrosanguineum]KAJ5133720.1 acetyltransferase [Penicillium atrosanguineum]KAJ5149679.1 acetyltransferase [Penicillium atrosanguineum]KAJ5304996.1 MFS-type transporter [Penicillium atrosanguineum]KAJ5324462.1 acetyltransferase [Penicillium atrosanguineum]
MSTTSTLKLETLTIEDNSALTDLWFAAFSDPILRRVFPNTPGVRKWLENANAHDLLNKSFQRYIKVVDTESQDAEGRPRIAAYAKWDLSMPEERGRRYPPWHEEMPGELCEAFFMKEEANRKRVMGDTRHFYLDTVATHPDYQRRGAGSLLVKWGCDLADAQGVQAYVDASKDGAPLYAKFGFVDHSLPGEDIASMARR